MHWFTKKKINRAEIHEGELIILLVKDLNNESQPSWYKWWTATSPATSLYDDDLEWLHHETNDNNVIY